MRGYGGGTGQWWLTLPDGDAGGARKLHDVHSRRYRSTEEAVGRERRRAGLDDERIRELAVRPGGHRDGVGVDTGILGCDPRGSGALLDEVSGIRHESGSVQGDDLTGMHQNLARHDRRAAE